MKGNSKRYLSLLGDSVYTEDLDKELTFARLLPEQMSNTVLVYIYKVYVNKMKLLTDESLTFFTDMMKVSSFRRCI